MHSSCMGPPAEQSHLCKVAANCTWKPRPRAAESCSPFGLRMKWPHGGVWSRPPISPLPWGPPRRRLSSRCFLAHPSLWPGTEEGTEEPLPQTSENKFSLCPRSLRGCCLQPPSRKGLLGVGSGNATVSRSIIPLHPPHKAFTQLSKPRPCKPRVPPLGAC